MIVTGGYGAAGIGSGGGVIVTTEIIGQLNADAEITGIIEANEINLIGEIQADAEINGVINADTELIGKIQADSEIYGIIKACEVE